MIPKLWTFLVFTFFLSKPLLSQTPSFMSLKNSNNGKHSILYNIFVDFFPFFSRSRSMFYASSSGMTQGMRITILNMHRSPQIPFPQDDSAALRTWSSTRVLLKNFCISLWLWERKEEQYPGAGLSHQGWFICTVIMTDLTPKCGKGKETLRELTSLGDNHHDGVRTERTQTQTLSAWGKKNYQTKLLLSV